MYHNQCHRYSNLRMHCKHQEKNIPFASSSCFLLSSCKTTHSDSNRLRYRLYELLKEILGNVGTPLDK